jgi:hypothetical protein
MNASLGLKGVQMLALRTVEDIDNDLRNLRNIIADSLRDSDPWNVAWERINQLLEERIEIIKEQEKCL